MKKFNAWNVLVEGTKVASMNFFSVLGAVLLWIVTIWIPYINVGTTIAMCSIPLELSKGNVINPAFIFDSRYRRNMGEAFLYGILFFLGVVCGFLFGIIPGYVISLSWCLGFYILMDKGVNPMQALSLSNKAMYGHKWTVFFACLLLGLFVYVVYGLIIVAAIVFEDASLGNINEVPWVLALLLIVVLVVQVIEMGLVSVVYRELVLRADKPCDDGCAANECTPVAEGPETEA